MMFIEENCERCGSCLSKCPYLDVSEEKAKEEIIKMIETRTASEFLDDCLECAYCNTICPTKSNPRELIREITIKAIREKGLLGLNLMSEQIPLNRATISLGFESETKHKNLKEYLHPPKSEKMFFLGCSLSYRHTDLVNSKILDEFPKIGGLKYCCGGYVKNFGTEEVILKGKALLEEFELFRVSEFIIICPGCTRMMKDVYSNLIPEFQEKIKVKTFSQYLIEKYHNDELTFTNKIRKRITFHDPCAWRSLDSEVFDAPRELLEILGVELVEMKHKRKKTLCCGSSCMYSKHERFKEVSEMRISEAEEVEAELIAVSCTGCLALAKPSRNKNIETYHLLELAQIAIGEKPPHRTIEISEKLNDLVNKTINENPYLIKDKYLIKDGKIHRVQVD